MRNIMRLRQLTAGQIATALPLTLSLCLLALFTVPNYLKAASYQREAVAAESRAIHAAARKDGIRLQQQDIEFTLTGCTVGIIRIRAERLLPHVIDLQGEDGEPVDGPGGCFRIQGRILRGGVDDLPENVCIDIFDHIGPVLVGTVDAALNQ